MMHLVFFEFEADFVASLRCVPMIVRYKLDLCGIKLSLRSWSCFSTSIREALVAMPTESAAEVQEYGQFVSTAILEIGEPVKEMPLEAIPAWMDTSKVPERVSEKVAELRVVLNGNRRWSELNALQRFALFKLTRGGHENNNFLPALREFGLAG